MPLVLFLMILPIVITVANIFILARGTKIDPYSTKIKLFDLFTLLLGICLTLLLMELLDIRLDMDWQEVLVNIELHTPIYTEAQPTVIFIWALWFVGYVVLMYIKVEKLSPLMIVIAISALYLGIVQNVIFMIQIHNTDMTDSIHLFLILLPLNCTLISIRVIRAKIVEWKDHRSDRYQGNGLLDRCNRFLSRSTRWPLAAFVLALPLLGVIIIAMMLFGQRPDSVIKAWTETSDWTLSQHQSPPNVSVDQHYLCTVAAGGHQRIVKPIRRGVRHGNEVIVNRQLCIANAFEQLLEERTPRFHKMVRCFYDKYGFPLSKLIRSKVAADIVYLLMKPPEWIFLFVLYLADTDPESRIIIQYTGKRLVDIRG